jgi:hypothetical protein
MYARWVPATLNDAFYPVLLSRLDDPLTRREVEAYFQKIAALADKGRRKGEQYVVIVLNDVTKFTAANRKQVAEVQALYLTPEQNAVTLAAFIPIDNALVRGALTALGWFAPEMAKSTRPVASLEVALEEALRLLETKGFPFNGNRKLLRLALGLQS